MTNMKRVLVIIVLLVFPLPALALETNDPYVGEQWYLEQIHAPTAWDTETGSRAVIVAVIDAGVDIDHPDLAANIWRNTQEVPENGKDDNENGYIDDVYGWDFVQNDNDPSPDVGPMADEEAAAHGSLVAGLIGAFGNNAEGVTGVAWQVRIMPLRALNSSGSGSSYEVSEAIAYAVDNGADVINLSFSGPDADQLLSQAVKDAYEAGVVVVSALGNENTDTDVSAVYPSCYRTVDDDWIIGVASTNTVDEKALFSNYGETCADIAAPGVNIFGVSVDEPEAGFDVLYAGGWTGTSMSSPLVAGASALILSAYPNLTPDQVRIALQLGVDPVFGLYRGEIGTGRLNVARALEVAGALAIAGEEIVAPHTDLVDVGDLFKSPSYPDVYVVTPSLGRRVFISHTVYFTYTNTFDSIVEVRDEDLAAFPLEGLVLPKAGTVLVKIPSVNTVYALEENPDNTYVPFLRAIASEDIAITMYGTDWADFVIDIDPAFFNHFEQGTDITFPEPVDTSIMKKRETLSA